MRLSAALGSIVGLIVSLLLAPFMHVHAADHHGDASDHGSAIVHSHFSPHTSHHGGKSSVSDADDDEDGVSPLNLFNFATVTSIVVPDLAATGLVVPALQAEFRRCTIPQVRTHDPPLDNSPGLRAPPA